MTLRALNGFNRHIRFTVERERDGVIPFLDMKVIRTTNGAILTDWYRKPTASDRYIHAASSHPFSYKLNTIKGLKSRVLRLSDVSFHEKNLNILKDIFIKNGFDHALLHRLLFSTVSNQGRPGPEPPDPTEPAVQYRSLPMIGGLTSILRGLFRSVPVKIAVTTRRSIGGLFTSLKDETPKMDTCNVVYCIQCNDCEGCYIGMTGQRLKSRLGQHIRDIKNKRSTTALCAHTTEHDHTMDMEGVSVFASDHHYRGRAFKEMCYIRSRTNALNFVTDLQNLSPVYTNLIALAMDRRAR